MGASAQRSRAPEYAAAAGIVALATALCLALRAHLATVDVAMLLLVGVVAVSTRYRRGPALLASVLSTAAFDYLFVPPYYTFDVRDPAYILTFGVMLLVALTISRLTARIREQHQAVAARERRTSMLLSLESDLAAAPDIAALRSIAATHLGRAGGGTAAVILLDELGEDRAAPAWPTEGIFRSPTVRIAASWALQRGEPTGWGTPNGREVEAMLAPLRTSTDTIGLVAIAPEDSEQAPPEEQAQGLVALVDLLAGALERRLLADRTERARAQVEAEQLRTALLSSLSHDLRTPLAGIEGAASSLLQETAALSPEVQRELLEGILDESRRMTRLITNLLDMIRVQSGTLSVQKSWQPLEEPLGVVLLRLEEDLRAHPVTTRIPDDLPLVPIDELLIEQVLLNLVENAIRYAPPGSPIEITARREEGAVLVEVLDRGPGVPPGQEEAVFERFYRATPADSAGAGAGSGLGLTICRGIITAHGGHIWFEPRPGGGAAVRFTLPLKGPSMEPVPVEPLEP